MVRLDERGRKQARERGREESMWFTVRLVARVWLLRFRSHNSRCCSFYLFICLCKPPQTLFMTAWHLSTAWYFLPMRYLNPCQAFIQSFPIFSLSHPFCFSPITWRNRFLHCASLIAKIQFNDRLYIETDLTWLDTSSLEIDLMICLDFFPIPFYERILLA